jgi:hypothetical protein
MSRPGVGLLESLRAQNRGRVIGVLLLAATVDALSRRGRQAAGRA